MANTTKLTIYNHQHNVSVIFESMPEATRTVAIKLVKCNNKLSIKVEEVDNANFHYTGEIDDVIFNEMKNEQLLEIDFTEMHSQIVDLLQDTLKEEQNLYLRLEANEKGCKLIFCEKSRFKSLIYLTIDLQVTNHGKLIEDMAKTLDHYKIMNNHLNDQVEDTQMRLQQANDTLKQLQNDEQQKQIDELKHDLKEAMLMIAQKTKIHEDSAKDLVRANSMIVNLNNQYDRLNGWIKDIRNNLGPEKLLEYCQLVYEKMEGTIESLEAFEESNIDSDDAAEYLWNIVDIITTMVIADNLEDGADDVTLYNNLKKLVKRLLTHFKDIDINDTIFRKPLQIDHEIGNSIFDEEKYAASHLLKIVNKRDQNDKSALEYATEQKHYDLACILLLHGANINSLSVEQQQELLLYSYEITHNSYALQDNDMRPIIGLLAMKVPDAVLNYSDDYEYPRLLSYFCAFGHTKVIASLLGAINPDRKLKIINHGYNGVPPIRRANNSAGKLNDDDHLQIIKYLIEQGATTVDNINHIEHTLQSAASEGHLETFKYLVDQGNKKDFNTYIGLATIDNHINIIEFLWQNYRHYTTGYAGYTALHYAAWRGGLPSMKYLCENGADVNLPNTAGETPLDIAIDSNNMDVIKYLVLERNASGLGYNKKDTFSTLQKFLNIEDIDINNISDSFGNSLLHDAVKVGKMVFIKHLVAKDIDINKPNTFGITPLHLAVQNTYDNITKFLLQHGAIYDIPTKDNRTALDLAKHSNIWTLKIVHDLFESSNLLQDLDEIISMTSSYKDAFDPNNPMVFLINIRNNQGQTLLHKSIAMNDADATLLILKYNKSYIGMSKPTDLAKDYVGINISLKDIQGNTALHLAACNGNIEIVNALINEDLLDINVKNNLGHTPIVIAENYGHKDVVKVLSEKI